MSRRGCDDCTFTVKLTMDSIRLLAALEDSHCAETESKREQPEEATGESYRRAFQVA